MDLILTESWLVSLWARSDTLPTCPQQWLRATHGSDSQLLGSKAEAVSAPGTASNQRLTSAPNDSSHKEGNITVVQLQCIELHCKVELGLHDITEGFLRLFKELTGYEAIPIGYQHPSLFITRRQHRKYGFVNSILQQGDLVVQVQACKPQDGLGELRELGGQSPRTCTGSSGRCGPPPPCSGCRWPPAWPGVFSAMHRRLHVVDDEGLGEPRHWNKLDDW